MKIGVDILSGEQKPEVLIRGAVKGLKKIKGEIVLIGPEEIIEKTIEQYPWASGRIRIEHTEEVISMREIPTEALKKKPNSSVAIGMRLIEKGEIDAFVSPGNTGATIAAAYRYLGRLKGVARPGILAPVPDGTGGFTALIDVGANPECKPVNLVQFAVMGEVYMREVCGVAKPLVGILSNGEERYKGTELTRKAFKILSRLGCNFVGYVEGRDIFTGKLDVAVCDGFTGNIILKTVEGMGLSFINFLKNMVSKNILKQVGALVLLPEFRELKKRMDYAEYGGAPLLGMNGHIIITHGSSGEKEIMNAVRIAGEMVNHKLNQNIVNALINYGINKRQWF